MNWKATTTTDNAKNTIWYERCVKELKTVKPIETWRVNPQYLQRSMLTEGTNKRGNRFLKSSRMQEALNFGSSDQGASPARAQTEISNYSTAKSTASEALGLQAMDDVKQWFLKRKQRPEEKYAQPLTSGQEYGWNCQPEARAPLPHHRHVRHGRAMCDVTRIANQMLAASGATL